MAYVIKIKGGDQRYTFNEKTGRSEWKNIDFVEEHDNLVGALQAFLSIVDDIENGWNADDDKVTLVFNKNKKAKK